MSISIYQDYEHLLSGMPVLVHNILNIEAFCNFGRRFQTGCRSAPMRKKRRV